MNMDAQSKFTIDLSKNSEGIITRSVVENKKIEIIITNRLPNGKYEVEINKREQQLELLNFGERTFKIPSDMKEKSFSLDSPCTKIGDLIQELKKTDNEKNVKNLLDEIKTEKKKLEKEDGCKDLKKYEAYLEYTKDIIDDYKLNRGELLEITISRKIGEDSTKIWKHIFKTRPRGDWLINYGFTFPYDIIKKERHFFAKPMSGDSSYIITKKKNRSLFSYKPSIFFSWMPTQKFAKSNLAFGGTAGLGADTESVSIFGGASLFYNENVIITSGLVFHQQQFLRGEYKKDEIIETLLLEEQLHENRFTCDVFVAFSFRFNSNPFKNNNSDSVPVENKSENDNP